MKTIEKDILIIGAGLIGSSVAMHLAGALAGTQSVGVVDVDLEGSFSSSELNAGGVRMTFNHPLNQSLSLESIRYYETVREEIGFRQKGYFWMYSNENWSAAKTSLSGLAHLGVEVLERDEISARHPFLDKVADLGGASFSSKDGLLNPNLLKLHYRKRASENGAEFLDRIWVKDVVEVADGFQVNAFVYPRHFSEADLADVLSGSGKNGEEIRFKCKKLVNCSGAWANNFYKMLGLKEVCHPVRRQVSLFECKEVDLSPYGMFVDSSGVYFHAEAHMILAGYAVDDEKPGFNFHYDGGEFFEQYIWAPLYERSSCFENLKHITGWAGLYEVSLDRFAVLGELPGKRNFFEAHSFSGRGAMQSYAAGKILSEKIVQGSYSDLIWEKLSAHRFNQADGSGYLMEERVI